MRRPNWRWLAALALGTVFTGPAQAQSMIEGTWLTPDQAEMTIGPCDKGLCGRLSRIVITDAHVAQYGVDASSIDVSLITDVFNEDPALKGRPMLGLTILMLRATDNPWKFEGEIYNPQDGKTYQGYIDVKDADSIVLKGCALYVLCQEQIWTRVLLTEEETLERQELLAAAAQ